MPDPALLKRLSALYEDMSSATDWSDCDEVLRDFAKLLDEIDPKPYISRATIVEAASVAARSRRC